MLSLASAGAGPLPRRTPPVGFASVKGTNGGRIPADRFTGDGRSAAVVPSDLLRALRSYFDGAAAVSGVVGDPNDRGIMAFIDARPQGPPVRGVALVQLNDGGRGGVAIIFADAVVRADPSKFRLVPLSQYRTSD